MLYICLKGMLLKALDGYSNQSVYEAIVRFDGKVSSPNTLVYHPSEPCVS